MPAHVDVIVYWLAPAISMVTALFVYAVIPFGPEVMLFGQRVPLRLADVNVGILLVLATSSVGVYGIILGGWSSNNKYSLLGSLRSGAQLISYELALGLAVISVVLTAGSLSLVSIVEAQRRVWFVALQPLGFLIFLIAAVAETNRAPFGLPAAEQEIIAGYQTANGGLEVAMFYIRGDGAPRTMSAPPAAPVLGGRGGAGAPGAGRVVVKKTGVVVFFFFLRA